MIDVETKLPDFALPFVLRSLRRRRGRRYLALSLLLALVTVAIGLWLGLGVGQAEQNFRVATGFELPLDQRELNEFTVFARDEQELEMLTSVAAQLEREGPCGFHGDRAFTELDRVAEDGRGLLRAAKFQEPDGPAELDLQRRVLELMEQCPQLSWDPFRSVLSLDLSDPVDVATLEQILAARGIPKVERYSSPLDSRALIRLIGGLASFVLAAIATVFAPLAVAMAQAQERRENTLMPLTGTTLSPRQLALGLASGPAVVVAIYAAPQLLMYAIAVVVTGRIGPGLLVLLALTGVAVSAGSIVQVLAHRLGRRRTPWAIGIGLLVVLSSAWLVVLAAYDESEWWRLFGPASTLLPHLAIPELLRWTFAADGTTPSGIGRVLTISAVVEVGLAILAIRVLAQELAGRSPQLRAWQAGLGACLALLAVDSAFVYFPDPAERGLAALYLGSAALLLPFGFLLTTRVPGGDAPAKLRRVPLLLLLAEMLAWAAAHLLITRLWGATSVHPLEPVSVTWLGWCFVTVALLGIRLSVRAPTSLASQAWTVVCAVFVVVALVEAIDSVYPRLDHPSLLASFSPVLGVVELVLVVAIPISLVRHLARSLGGIR